MYGEVTIVGNLGGDATTEEVNTRGGLQTVVRFNVAVNIGRDDTRRTHWYRVTAWGNTASGIAPYLRKGRLVLVKGSLPQVSLYTDKYGQPAYSQDVTANMVRLLDSNRKDEESAPAPSTEDLGDIPF